MTAKSNSQVILANIIQKKCAESENDLTLSEFFEIYTASEILKNYDLTYDDVRYGVVGDGGDGGIDSIYTFVNGELFKEDTALNANQKGGHIELVVVQSKTSASFTEDAISKFRESAQDLFNLANDLADFTARYNAQLIDRANLFRSAYVQLAPNFPEVRVKYYYATQGESVHDNVEGKVPKLKEDIATLFSGAIFEFYFLGATQLLALTRSVPSLSRNLTISESEIGTQSGSYLCLTSLSDYYNFISDDGSLARSIFESNVRDYQGNVVVNSGIRSTLQNKNSDNFWYLNNGVTIITPKAVSAGKQLTIEAPQIVNGLQTSYEIYRHFSELIDATGDDRTLLVRVICEEDEDARDRIIRATNSQTSIPPASLRSSDHIHRNIEDFFKVNGFYYDRKKNYYKNEGKPISKIISIAYMAQAMMAITLLQPDNARARPSTLINNDTAYKSIFNANTSIDVYLKAIQIVKIVENYLKPENCQIELERKTVTNIKYYVAMVIGVQLTGALHNIIERLSALPSITIDDALLADALGFVLHEFSVLGHSDQVAKSTELRDILIEKIATNLSGTEASYD